MNACQRAGKEISNVRYLERGQSVEGARRHQNAVIGSGTRQAAGCYWRATDRR